LRALEVIDERQERRRRENFAAARPGGLAAAGHGTDDAAGSARRAHRRRQHARHRQERAVERELAERHVVRDLLARQHVHGGEQRQRDRQVEMAAFLDEVGGRQIDGDALMRQRQAQRRQRRADALAGFAHRLVGKADDREARQCAVGKRHLRLDIEHFDARERHRMYARDQSGLFLPTARSLSERRSRRQKPANSCMVVARARPC
jgi:hypothetical protein